MSWAETIRTGLTAIRNHAMRSVLTVVGILIGIAAVILTVGLGLGTQQDVSRQISSLGANLLIITPGSTTSSAGVRGGFGSATTLTTADAAALASKVAAPDVAGVAPEKRASEAVTAGTSNWTTTVIGTTTAWPAVRSRTMADGAFFTAAQEQSGAAVVVLGPETAKELFGTTSVVGQSVTIGSSSYQVTGVLASAGSSNSTNLDDMAVMPLSTAATQVIGGTSASSVSTIYVQAASAGQLPAAYQEATQILLNSHGISDPDSPDFTVQSQDSLVSTATSVYRTLTVLLVGIAAISLIVGGIGVMNIMLVSVTERTREIGLRKAIGAPPRAIRRQFLTEAVVLGLAGGLLGALLGIAGAALLPGLLGTTIVISPWAVGGSIAVAIAIGIIFGVYPATRAARLSPIDALRV